MAALEAVSPRIRVALDSFVGELRHRFGPRLKDLRLFGSQARGDAHPESDVDVLVVLDEVDWPTKREVLDLAADISLEHDVLLSPTVLDNEVFGRWRAQERALVSAIEREGIPLP